MRGKDYIEKLIAQQENRYFKKFAFERGQYHQCIPNPRIENQMITVQLVYRLTDAVDKNTNDDDAANAFSEG